MKIPKTKRLVVHSPKIRIPVPKPGRPHKDKTKYNRHPKHRG